MKLKFSIFLLFFSQLIISCVAKSYNPSDKSSKANYELEFLRCLNNEPGSFCYCPMDDYVTFVGGIGTQYGSAAVQLDDKSILVAGATNSNFGSPIVGYTGGDDIFLAKIGIDGSILWNTMLGNSLEDENTSNVVKLSNGLIIIASNSLNQIGQNVLRAHPSSGTYYDSFIALYDSVSGQNILTNYLPNADNNGVSQFIRTNDGAGVFITGNANQNFSQGNLVLSHSANLLIPEPYLMRVDSAGNILWQTFFSSGVSNINTRKIYEDLLGNIYLTGDANTQFGSPVNPHSGTNDSFIIKFSASGVLQWLTFFGVNAPTQVETTYDILELNGSLFISGGFLGNFAPNPVRSYSGNANGDVGLLKLNLLTGQLEAHTFIGFVSQSSITTLQITKEGNIRGIGQSDTAFGTPATPFNGGTDGLIFDWKSDLSYFAHGYFGTSQSESVMNTAELCNRGRMIIGSGLQDFENVKVHHSTSLSDAFLKAIH
ncbi:hypothetical protein CH373_01045 [Leptospira perolatii]|uniref:Beta-propeller repeat protein n=1 Tax=Leptospira perolatii TaxID=2023191 RepID=A0A2M9ZRF1_9LEPT|nr:hypothetical protein [Leptospira perolatii]PJZ71136.1 hypothetical protein CH360_01045 [Leptospira perolatii]PJZ74668.1 hypothetical protein CH373_01045 [Leptospira perolatii]